MGSRMPSPAGRPDTDNRALDSSTEGDLNVASFGFLSYRTLCAELAGRLQLQQHHDLERCEQQRRWGARRWRERRWRGDDSPAISSNFSFFITSGGTTNGGNLGGFVGADKRCQDAAGRIGAGGKTWHAYLSLSADPDGTGPVNARDRIGSGPWYNVRGVLIAMNVVTLHEEGGAGMNGITAATGLDENGNEIPGGDADAGVAPQHDI
jgi:hypothetical protein